MTLKLDEEDKKEPVLNVRIVEEPVYGYTDGSVQNFDTDHSLHTKYTQSQKIEIYLRWIYYLLGVVIVVGLVIAYLLLMIIDGFEVWTTVELR